MIGYNFSTSDLARATVGNAASNLKNSIQKTGTSIANFVGRTVTHYTDPNTQITNEAGNRAAAADRRQARRERFEQTVGAAGRSFAEKAREAVTAMETTCIDDLKARRTINRPQVDNKILNKIIRYSETVSRTSEEVSRTVGESAHAVVRGLLGGGRALAQEIGWGETGAALFQNAAALALGHVFRAVTLAIMNIVGQTLPYIIAAAIAVGVVIGIAAIATVSPLAAVATVIGLLALGYGIVDQAQKSNTQKQLNEMKGAINNLRNNEEADLKELPNGTGGGTRFAPYW